MDAVKIAYCAGLIDGEGCIRIKRTKAYKCQDRKTPGYHAVIQVRMVEEGAIKFLSETLGGWYFKERPSERRPLYCWQVSDAGAEKIIRTVEPLLIVKRQQARLVIGLRELQSTGKQHRTKIVGYRNFPNKYGTARQVPNLSFSDEYVAQCESLYQQCKALNRVGLAAMVA